MDEYATTLASLTAVTEKQLAEIAAKIGKVIQTGDLLMLHGELGTGKTTFTKALGKVMNVREPITSPTFVLARTHPNLGKGPALTHVDAYRLSSGTELEDLDLDIAGTATVVEWGRNWGDRLADHWVSIVLTPDGVHTRSVEISGHELINLKQLEIPANTFADRVRAALNS